MTTNNIEILTYRDTYFPNHIDSHLWKQVIKGFGVKLRFLDDGNMNINPDILVIFDEVGDIPLADFNHPEEAQYLFGCTGMTEIPKQFPAATSVRIEVPNILVNRGLFASQAAGIVLYDREVKSWQ